MEEKSLYPLKLVYCYARKDRALRDELDKHLTGLRHSGLITTWYDGDISAGASWEKEIDTHLHSAHIILLLVSSDFISSSYCYNYEMAQAIERHLSGNTCVIPILLRPVDYRDAPFASIEMLPSNTLPVTSWGDQDEAFEDTARAIRRVVLNLFTQNAKGRQQLQITQHEDSQNRAEQQETVFDTPQRREFMLQDGQRGRHYHIAHDLHIHEAPVSKDALLEMKNRAVILDRVEQTWIKGLLEKSSFYQQVQITLQLQEQSQAVSNPWRDVIQELGSPISSLSVDTLVRHVSKSRSLLILGSPGAGKTTLLLEVLTDLIAKARQDNMHPLPVVFNLSSWATRRQPLERWFIDELRSRYQIPYKQGALWMKEQAILPLLDGLDEVMQPARAACIDAINIYRDNYGLAPLVVCSRHAEYEQLIMRTQLKLNLDMAILLQPLTLQQINAYLTEADVSLAPLNIAIQNNRTLQELSDTPLMLAVLSEIYKDIPLQHLLEIQVQQIFALYIQKMLERRSRLVRYTNQHIKHWLARLADQMQRRGQTEFYLEQLQKDWLFSDKIYRICLGLVFGLIAGIFVLLIYTVTFLFTPVVSKSWPFLIGTEDFVAITILYGVVFNFLAPPAHARGTMLIRRSALAVRRKTDQLFQNEILYGLLLGFIHFLVIRNEIILPFAVIHSLIFGIGYALIGRIDTYIRPAEAVAWSWSNIKTRLTTFLGSGLLFGLVFSLTVGPIIPFIWNGFHAGQILTSFFNPTQLLYLLVVGIAVGLSCGFIFMWVGGISYTDLNKDERLMPNQGILHSARNSLILGFTSGVLVGTISALLFGPGATWLGTILPNTYPKITSQEGICWGVAIGIAILGVVALRNGGIVCIQHYMLRFFLFRSDILPWNVVYMLDEAANHNLLYKIGGGYRFIHDLFLNYFASTIVGGQKYARSTLLNVRSDTFRKSKAPTLVKIEWFVTPAMLAILIFVCIVGVNVVKVGTDVRISAEQTATTEVRHPYPSYLPGRGKLVVYDPLNILNKQWDEIPAVASACYFLSDGYHARQVGISHLQGCLRHQNFSNFAFEAHMVITHGNCGGIIFRYTSSNIGASYYNLSVCLNGGYVFQKVFRGNLQTRSPSGRWSWYPSSAIHIELGQVNTMVVVAQKNRFILFFNQQEIAEFFDNDMTSGTIGLLAGNLETSNLTEVLYTNAKIWTL